MARLRQRSGASSVRKVPHALWERAGASAGDGADALFAHLGAQNGQNPPPPPTDEQRELTAQALERLAAQVRAGAWNAQLAQLAALLANMSANLPAPPAPPAQGPR